MPRPFNQQKQQHKHPKQALVEDKRVRSAVEPAANGHRIGPMAVNIGQRLDDDETNHGQRSPARQQSDDDQQRQDYLGPTPGQHQWIPSGRDILRSVGRAIMPLALLW